VPYFAYLLRCADDTFYAGICTDIQRRLAEHNGTAAGARYTRSRRPVALAHLEECADRSSALKREHALRQLSRIQKQRLSEAYTQGSASNL
jgi:putative endonuclease